MYKVLIVDDFLPDRESLKEIIDSLRDDGIEVIGECDNGLDALQFMESDVPDIVVSDIEMPLMNGLELAKNIRTCNPNIKIIFCSLYNEFEYVRKALYLESYGYILKPVNAEELRECIRKVTGQITHIQRQTNEHVRLQAILNENIPALSESFIRDLVYGINRDSGDIWEKIDFLKVNLKKGVYVLTLVEIDDYDKITSDLKIEKKQIFSFKVLGKIKELLLKANMDQVVTKLDEYHFLIIFNFPTGTLPEECCKGVCAFCSKVVLEFSSTDISVSLALSKTCDDIFELNDLFEQCKYILKYKYILGKGKVLQAEDIPAAKAYKNIDFNTLQKEIRFLLNSGSASEIESYLEKIHQGVSCNSDEYNLKNFYFYIMVCIQMVLSENNVTFEEVFNEEKLVWEKLIRFETILDVKNWLKNTFVFIREYLSKKVKHKNSIIAEEVRQYIRNNFSESLCIENIADRLFYSPNYLNYIFKLETGETINDYVIKAKVEKAKEILADPKVKLYELAESLGYKQPAYFSNVFKKITGLTPKEYRERIQA